MDRVFGVNLSIFQRQNQETKKKRLTTRYRWASNFYSLKTKTKKNGMDKSAFLYTHTGSRIHLVRETHMRGKSFMTEIK